MPEAIFEQTFLDPAAIAARLTAKIPALRKVGTARDLANATVETVQAPTAWVVIMSEAAGDVRYEVCDVIEQLITVRFGVILAVRDIASGKIAIGDDDTPAQQTSGGVAMTDGPDRLLTRDSLRGY